MVFLDNGKNTDLLKRFRSNVNVYNFPRSHLIQFSNKIQLNVTVFAF